jgi:hypothetical protein
VIMSKYVLILTLVLLAPSAFAVETQQATSGVGRASIEAQSNAGRGSGEEFTAQAQLPYTSSKFPPTATSYFAEDNGSILRLVADPQPSGEASTKAEPPSARPGEIPADTPYPIHPPVWRKATEIYFNSGPPRQPVGVGYLSTCWSASGTCVNVGPPPQTWYLVDLTKCTELAPWCLPSDAAFAFVTAIMVQTSGNRLEGAGFGIVFRRPGDTNVTCDSHNYTGQTFLNAYSPPLGFNNNRAEFSTWIPLAEGKFEYCWRQTSTTGTFPTHPNGATYAVNMSLQAWAR